MYMIVERIRILGILIILSLSLPALADDATPVIEPKPSAPVFVPIVLDQARTDALLAKLDEIAMPARTYRQIIAIFQELERDAQAKAAEAKKKEEKEK